MARFRTVKQALGVYANWLKGPRLAQREIGPYVQESVSANPEDGLRVAEAVKIACEGTTVTSEQLRQWATHSDGVVPMLSGLGGVLALLREELEFAGLLEPKVKPVQTERIGFVDLNTGEWVETSRERKIWKPN